MSQRRSDIKEQWITDFKAPGPKTGLHCELNRNKQQESKFKERDDKVSMSIHITDSQSHVPAKPGHWQHASHHTVTQSTNPWIFGEVGSTSRSMPNDSSTRANLFAMQRYGLSLGVLSRKTQLEPKEHAITRGSGRNFLGTLTC